MLSLEGRQLGNYDVTRRIRVGGMGAVYEGKQRTAFGRRVAIKVILGDYAGDTDMRRRFAREARTIARLHHPHILPLIEFGDEGGLLFLVMPFIDGGTLTAYLRRSLPDIGEVSTMYQQLLDAVEYAHEEGLIHRDIKSSNVLLEMRRSGPPYAYLADFGLVRTLRHGDMDQTGQSIPLDQVPGTPHYMAPEQTRGIVTPQTDIYALGVLLYQMLTGELPYDDPDEIRVIQMHLQAPIPSPSARDVSIPAALDEVVRTAMAKHPEDRFQSVTELRAAFLRAVDGSAKIARDDLIVEEIVPEPERSPRASIPLQPLELPAPVVAERRQLKQTVVQPEQGRRRVTESVRNKPQRTTESIPGKRRRRRRASAPVAAVVLAPLFLLAVLLVPRLLGISLFPVGFPLLGADPTTTVTITPVSKTLKNSFELTASPLVKTPQQAQRIIPDHAVFVSVSGSRSGSATGSATIQGTQATGTLLFVNATHTRVTVPAGTAITSITNVQVQTTAQVTVPPRQQGENGTGIAPAIALVSGAAGNIGANTVNTKCCNNLSVSNPNPFSGGTEDRTVPVVAQSDIDHTGSTLTTQLEQEALQKLLQMLPSGEVLTGLPAYSVQGVAATPVGTQAAQVTVQEQVKASGIAYSQTMANQMTSQLLSQQAAQQFGDSYQVQGAITTAVPRIVQRETSGVVFLSITARGVWRYHFTAQQVSQWRESVKGLALANALSYLNQQTGVAAVQIHLPFGTSRLPSSSTNIQIVFAPA